MSTPAAIEGDITGYRRTADGGLRITIDLDEPQTRAFHLLFVEFPSHVAVARMENPEEVPSDRAPE